jgi:hypothetical protein
VGGSIGLDVSGGVFSHVVVKWMSGVSFKRMSWLGCHGVQIFIRGVFELDFVFRTSDKFGIFWLQALCLSFSMIARIIGASSEEGDGFELVES